MGASFYCILSLDPTIIIVRSNSVHFLTIKAIFPAACALNTVLRSGRRYLLGRENPLRRIRRSNFVIRMRSREAWSRYKQYSWCGYFFLCNNSGVIDTGQGEVEALGGQSSEIFRADKMIPSFSIVSAKRFKPLFDGLPFLQFFLQYAASVPTVLHLGKKGCSNLLPIMQDN